MFIEFEICSKGYTKMTARAFAKNLAISCLLALSVAAHWSPIPEKKTCWVWGDPHYYLFDGIQEIHYQGNCKYLLAGTCPCSKLNDFKVYVTNEYCDDTNVTHTVQLEIHVNGHIVTFNRFSFAIEVNPPWSEYSGFDVDFPMWFLMRLITDDGIEVTYDAHSVLSSYEAHVTIPCKYFGEMCGICGNADGIENDYVTSDGTDVSVELNMYTLIGNSWQVDDGDSCGMSELPTEDYVPNMGIAASQPRQCAWLKKPGSSFFNLSKCIESYPKLAGNFLWTCNYDVSSAPNNTQAGCNALGAFIRECETRGFEAHESWRRISGCECLNGMVFSNHAPACPVTCGTQPSGPHCSEKPGKGCMCPTGTVLCEGRCRPPSRTTQTALHHSVEKTKD